MRRRHLLAVGGAGLAALAGCTGTDEPTGDSTPDARASVTFQALQTGLVALDSPDSIGVMNADSQYLRFEATAEGSDAPAADAFELRFAGETHTVADLEQPHRPWRYRGEASAYDAESGAGELLFELPESAEDGSARLAYPRGEWTADAALEERLASPTPSMSVTMSVPDDAVLGGEIPVTVTVENLGDVPGRFLGGLSRSGPDVAYTPVTPVSTMVEAGATASVEVIEELSASGAMEATYHLDSLGGPASVTVPAPSDE